MTSLEGLRIFIVEDNFLVADSLRTLITAYGGTIAAVVPSADAALEALESTKVDLAILDIHLKGEKVDRFADRLVADQIPFLFITGYGDDSVLPERLRGRPKLDKPVDINVLLETVARILGRS